ncbi:MAG: molecular chaperone TorD family protein [Planctomycetes bacterium]|nr:molecular chaperone TorD family protein [Planctomycetota bacterium]MBI3834861.1 molecular chaperone TorD family protein [Planctomycetota bacterium]
MVTLVEKVGTIAEAEVRAGIYALLSCIWRYPNDATLPDVAEMLRRLDELGVRRILDQEARSALDAIKTVVSDMRKMGESATHSLYEVYATLFGHTVRGLCPLYELEYGPSEIIQQSSELADIAGFYGAFGLMLGGAAKERPDHLAIECEFMSVLCAKEALGIQSENSALSDSCFDVQRTFLRDHLAVWVPSFCQRVSKADATSIYGLAARIARASIEAECRRFEISAGPEFLELRAIDPKSDVEIQCESTPGEEFVPLTVGGAVSEGN